MNFRTLIEKQCYKDTVSYDDNLFFIGSCFAENISKRLKDLKFSVITNPFGVVYNPASLVSVLDTIISNDEINDCYIVQNGDVWYSMLHSTKIFANSKEDLVLILNQLTSKMHEEIIKADKIFITLGTSWTYTHNQSSVLVNNCLKLPANDFSRNRLSVDAIVELFDSLFKKHEILKSKIIYFTVSPIRHFKDGFVENSISKSTLVVAANLLAESYDNVEYFPAFEIVNDELRDYRFYTEDMIHPSSVAVDYIFEKFKEWCLNNHAQNFCVDNKTLLSALNHRPTKINDPRYIDFCRKMTNKIADLSKKYKTISYICEKDFFNKNIH